MNHIIEETEDPKFYRLRCLNEFATRSRVVHPDEISGPISKDMVVDQTSWVCPYSQVAVTGSITNHSYIANTEISSPGGNSILNMDRSLLDRDTFKGQFDISLTCSTIERCQYIDDDAHRLPANLIIEKSNLTDVRFKGHSKDPGVTIKNSILESVLISNTSFHHTLMIDSFEMGITFGYSDTNYIKCGKPIRAEISTMDDTATLRLGVFDSDNPIYICKTTDLDVVYVRYRGSTYKYKDFIKYKPMFPGFKRNQQARYRYIIKCVQSAVKLLKS